MIRRGTFAGAALSVLLCCQALALQTPKPGTTSDTRTGPRPDHRDLLQSFTLALDKGGDWLILEVQQASTADTRVRFISAYPACGSFRVRAMDYIFENTSVQELAGKADLCVSDAISTEVILWAKTRKRAEMHDPFLGAMAVCGSNTVVKHLPPRDYVHLTILAIKAPGVAALWDLPDALQKRYEDQTGQTPFSSPNMTYEDWRLAHRSLSLHAAAQIRNGDFDLVMPPLPQAQGAGGKSKFSELVPDLEEATATETDFGAIQAQETLGLTKVVPVLYPPLARIAHIQGDVTLQLSIDQLGRVTETKATTGHPILKAAALDAAAHWFFAFPYTGPNPLAVTIHFEMHCPAMIDTASTHSRKAVHKKRKPPKRSPTR